MSDNRVAWDVINDKIIGHRSVDDEIADHREKEWVDHPGELTVFCSNCDQPLVVILITRPDAPVHNELVATCGLCDDKSFVKKFDGLFAIRSSDKVSMQDMKIVKLEETDNIITQTVLIPTKAR